MSAFVNTKEVTDSIQLMMTRVHSTIFGILTKKATKYYRQSGTTTYATQAEQIGV